MVSDTSEWIGTTLCDGRYAVLRKLGEGGMAHVYVARDAKLERDVVIKVPRSNLITDASFAGRFTREVRSLAKLAHPHVVPLIDIGQHEGVPFAVMHYLTGGSLRDRQPQTDDGRPAPAPVASLHTWLPAIAQALDFVHKNKFIHRDIKPENILFDEDDQVFLGDLGIIKALSEPADPSQRTVLTGAGMVLGTPQYMAPELIMGEAVDGRVDQYALAVTLYEALTGQVPFNGANAPAIFIQQTTKAPTPPRDLVPGIPHALNAAVLKALGKTPGERFATCVDFVNAALEIRPTVTSVKTPAVPETVREKLATPQPIHTVLEPNMTLRETPSNLRGPTTAANTPWQNAAPRKRSNAPLIIGLLAFGAIAAAVAAFFALPRGESATVKIQPVAAVSLTPGESAPVKIEIERDRIDGSVKCWLEGLPEGVKADEMIVPADRTKGTIDIEATTAAQATTATATLKAKCGSIETSVPVEIKIGASQASIKVVALAPQTLQAGGDSKFIQVYIERRRFEGPVNVSIDDLPEGVTWQLPYFGDAVIPASESDIRIELKAAATAPAVQNKRALVVAKNGKTQGSTPLLVSVLAAPTKTEPKVIDVITKKIDTPEVKKPIVEVKKPLDPEPVKPVQPPQLTIAKLPDVAMQSGERRTVRVDVERKNFAGPVAVAVNGLPAAGVRSEPAQLAPLPDGVNSFSFDLVADSMAGDARLPVQVTGLAGTLQSTSSFAVTVIRPKPLVRPVIIPPYVVNEAILFQKADKLTDFDNFDRVRTNSRAKSFPVPFKTGKLYVIDLTSDTFDPYLRIEDNNGNEVAVDDDSGFGVNARILFIPPANGVYHLVATSYKGAQLGAFTLTIR